MQFKPAYTPQRLTLPFLALGPETSSAPPGRISITRRGASRRRAADHYVVVGPSVRSRTSARDGADGGSASSSTRTARVRRRRATAPVVFDSRSAIVARSRRNFGGRRSDSVIRCFGFDDISDSSPERCKGTPASARDADCACAVTRSCSGGGGAGTPPQVQVRGRRAGTRLQVLADCTRGRAIAGTIPPPTACAHRTVTCPSARDRFSGRNRERWRCGKMASARQRNGPGMIFRLTGFAGVARRGSTVYRF